MPTEGGQTRQLWSVLTKGGLILLAAPFLFFPTLWTEATLVAMLLVAAVWLVTLRAGPNSTPFDIILFFFGLSLIIGILASADPELTLPKATGLILGLTVWQYLSQVINDRCWLDRGMVAYILLGLGFTGLGTLNANWMAKVPVLAAVVTRFPAFFLSLPDAAAGSVHPNQLAGTLLLYFPLPISIFIGRQLGQRSRLGSVIVLLAGFLVGGLLLLTQSRSGWVGAVGGGIALLGFWCAFFPASPRRRRIWLSIAAILIVGAILLASTVHERLQELSLDPQQEPALGNLASFNFRQEVWHWSLAAAGDFPFTGTGLGTFRAVVRRLYPLAISPTYDIAHAHNIFLQVTLDVGIPGLTAYMALLIVAGWVGWQVACEDETLRPLSLGLLAGMAALHIYGLTDALSLGSKTSVMFWMLLGLLTGMRRITRIQSTSPIARREPKT